MIIVSAVSVPKSEPQGRSGLVWENGGANGEKAIEGGCGQHMTTMTCRRWTNGSDCLRRGRQRNGLRDHLFDFRLCIVSGCADIGLCGSWTYLEGEH